MDMRGENKERRREPMYSILDLQKQRANARNPAGYRVRNQPEELTEEFNVPNQNGKR